MASRGHEIIVKTENYLKSIGKNNSIGKYDRIVRGVKSLLENGFLEGIELDKAIKQQADRLLKKYNLDSQSVYDKAIKMIDKAVKTNDVLNEVESKGPYMLAKEGSKWAVLRNGMPIKYGDEKSMRDFYKKVLKNNGYK